MARNAKTKKIITYGAASLACASILLTLIFVAIAPSNYALSISGLSDDASVNGQIAQTGAISDLSPHEKKTFHYKAPPLTDKNYVLSVSIEENANYRDIRFGMDRAGRSIIVSASGFKPQESLSIETRGLDAIDGLHFDWAGRIEITQPLPAKARYGSVCLKAASGFTACHDYDVKGQRT